MHPCRRSSWLARVSYHRSVYFILHTYMHAYISKYTFLIYSLKYSRWPHLLNYLSEIFLEIYKCQRHWLCSLQSHIYRIVAKVINDGLGAWCTQLGTELWPLGSRKKTSMTVHTSNPSAGRQRQEGLSGACGLLHCPICWSPGLERPWLKK